VTSVMIFLHQVDNSTKTTIKLPDDYKFRCRYWQGESRVDVDDLIYIHTYFYSFIASIKLGYPENSHRQRHESTSFMVIMLELKVIFIFSDILK